MTEAKTNFPGTEPAFIDLIPETYQNAVLEDFRSFVAFKPEAFGHSPLEVMTIPLIKSELSSTAEAICLMSVTKFNQAFPKYHLPNRCVQAGLCLAFLSSTEQYVPPYKFSPVVEEIQSEDAVYWGDSHLILGLLEQHQEQLTSTGSQVNPLTAETKASEQHNPEDDGFIFLVERLQQQLRGNIDEAAKRGGAPPTIPMKIGRVAQIVPGLSVDDIKHYVKNKKIKVSGANPKGSYIPPLSECQIILMMALKERDHGQMSSSKRRAWLKQIERAYSSLENE